MKISSDVKQIVLFYIVIVAAVFLLEVQYGAAALESAMDVDGDKYVAIVIDDFGNNAAGTNEMLNMDVQLTAAIMPGMPYSEQEAKMFYEAGKGVIVHMPMEAHNGKASWLGPVRITSDMSPEEVKRLVNSSFDEIKYAHGMNNHMGSKITENRELMTSVLEVLAERELIFVDSGTSPHSVVTELSNELNVRSLRRSAFLDGGRSTEQIKGQLRKAGSIADKSGYAIAIGHVGQEGGIATANAIKAVAPELMRKGIKFVTIAELYEILEGVE